MNGDSGSRLRTLGGGYSLEAGELDADVFHASVQDGASARAGEIERGTELLDFGSRALTRTPLAEIAPVAQVRQAKLGPLLSAQGC
jgi:hypothetical protein